MTLPSITPTQLQILLYLYKFRFLTTNQLQKLFGHKNPTTLQPLLKDLTKKEYVRRHYSRVIFGENTKPAIYFLASNARTILKKREDCDLFVLNRVYKEARIEQPFIDHCLFLADIYLYFLSQKKIGDDLQFFTKANLVRFQYFPEILPDSYISIKTKLLTKRYFLDLFDEQTPPFVMRRRIKQYISYAEGEIWQKYTDTELPIILLVCPNEKKMKHIFMYCKALLGKTIEEISFFLTTKDTIIFSKPEKNIWGKVE